MAERPFRTGDIVSLGGFEGEIVSTGMRSMTIRSWDRMEVIVPNSDMFTKPFVNWTHQDSIVRSVITIKVNRDDDPVRIQELVLEVLSKLDNVVDKPAPQVLMIDVDDWLLEMEVRFFLNLQKSKSRALVRSEVSMALVQCFKDNNIIAPYPKYEVEGIVKDQLLI